MNKIKSISVFCDKSWYLAEKQDELWKHDDAVIEIKENKLFITADKTRIHRIKLEFEAVFGKSTKILGDSWERSYGDMEWKSIATCTQIPWYFLAKDGEKTLGFGIKTQPNSMCCWEIDENVVYFISDISSGSKGMLLNGRTLEAAELVFSEYGADEYKAAQDFCKQMCDNPRLPKTPVYGGNDWYCNYGNNSYDKIIRHAKRIAECSPKDATRPYMVIDDGWEICHHESEGNGEYFNGGPWKYCNRNFGDMKKLAEEISSLGVIPGIWMRPLWTTEKFPKEYILKHQTTKFTLDPSVPEVLEQVKSDIREIVSWGYRLIKHDFTSFDIFGKWGNTDDYLDIEYSFADETKTTAEIIKDLYRAIREAAGEDTVIIGCNTISHLAAGFFEIQRTGDDTSGIEWERTKQMGVNTLAFRMCQHNNFYAADADCVGITNDVPWEKNRQWLDLLAKSGTPLFVSIAADAYSDKIKECIKEAFLKSCELHNPSRPLDWTKTLTPCVWESDFGTDRYVWD